MDAGRASAHFPDIGFTKANGLAPSRGDHNFILAGGRLDPGQVVIVFQLNRDQTGAADISKALTATFFMVPCSVTITRYLD